MSISYTLARSRAHFAIQVLASLSFLVPATRIEAARTCTITVSGLAFGSYVPARPTPLDSAATIQVTCVGDPDPGQNGYTISIDGGNSGSAAARHMLSGGNQLNYNLYQDAAFTTVWGDGTSGGSTVTQNLPGAMGMGMGMGMGLGLALGMGTGMGMGLATTITNSNHTVYGRAPALQDPVPGSYADAPIVTIEF